MGDPRNTALPRLRDWPMFRPAGKQRRAALEGRLPPSVSELVMERVPGAVSEKLAWLREQIAAGRLDGDDPKEVAQAEALLAMLARVSGARSGREKRHLDDLLDVAVGRFTSTEPPTRPMDRATTARQESSLLIDAHARERAAQG
jgi:hypothetical protein